MKTLSQSPRATVAARETVLVVPLADRSVIAITGKDRATWLNGLVTQEIAKLTPGSAAYSLLVEKKGRIQADLYVVAKDSALALVVPAGLRDALVETLDHYLIMEDAELTPHDGAVYLAVGPRAAELGAESAAEFAGALDLHGAAAVIVSPRSLDGAVAKSGGVLGDESDWDALRIERGLPRFGAEVDATLYPQEASLEKIGVSFEKGCYLGQEVVYMLENRGHVKKRLVPIDIDGDAAIDEGAVITTDAGEVVGDVRSSVALPSKVAAIAMIKWAQSKTGSELRVSGRAARVR